MRVKLRIYGDSISTGWRQTILHDMRKLCRQLPHAKVLVVEPYWPSGEEGPRCRQAFDIQVGCAEELGLPLVKGQRGAFGDNYAKFLYPEETQRIHPNDRGHARLAEIMTHALEPARSATYGRPNST